MKIAFLDVDGTLVDNKTGSIPQSAREAIRKSRALGNKVFVCTGRPWMHIGPDVLEPGFDGVISNNGSEVKVGDELIFDAVLNPKKIGALVQFLEDKKVGHILESKERSYVNKYYYDYLSQIKQEILARNNSDVIKSRMVAGKLRLFEMAENYAPYVFEEVQSLPISKLIFCPPPGNPPTTSLAEIRSLFNADFEMFKNSIPFFGETGGEITAKSVDKARGIAEVAKYYGVPIADTVAVGDGDNDRSMVEFAGIGVAMGNATPELIEVADFVTTTADKDGILNAFIKSGLL